MALKAGTSADFDNSMAAAIQTAFQAAWKDVMKADAPPVVGQMKVLFIAVATGVIEHIKSHPEAFTISIQPTGNDDAYTGEVTSIE